MDETTAKAVLHRYLVTSREALLWKLEGLSEYDVRRPLTPTGTNLLGLVKHLACVEAGYLGFVVGRPFPEPMPWDDEDAGPDDDLWARADESREDVLALYARATAHADASVEALPLDAPGEVPWWPEERRHPTLHTLLVHVVAEVARHTGHADVLRETVDGAVGLRPDSGNLTRDGDADWATHRARVERAAREASGRA
ncbi:putative damage-inducible protein DinB [Geodermatophilus bullaregiensis]|uniref:DinB family protein n=1 Tax=Geodermatophilus bullaregiensis TaxID=1564160 RepID=UPI00195A1454|nr:DinB family protein [Geodermatophilus bullaregiensis]MBM7804572.1 putative damage-inducible protein DinB [Geodermatophilus bullaregiensis]